FKNKTSTMEQLIKGVFVQRRGKGKRKGTEPYELQLKTEIIKEYLNGDVSFAMLSRRHKIHPGVISRWIRVIKNGRPVNKKKISKFTGMAQQQTIKELQEKIKQLNRQLEDERIKAGLYKKMIEIILLILTKNKRHIITRL
ncbi:MAG: transposase, partial [Chitinophagaceae bacterium]